MGTKIKSESLARRDGNVPGGVGGSRFPSIAADDAEVVIAVDGADYTGPDDDAGREAVAGDRAERSVMIQVPMSLREDITRASRKVLLSMNTEQSLKLRRLREALYDGGFTLKDGRYITDNNKALRWLLENLCPADKEINK